MIASHVTRDVLEHAAHVVGVRADITPLSGSGLRHRVKLYPIVPETAWQVAPGRLRDCPVCGERVLPEGGPMDTNRRCPACGASQRLMRWSCFRRWPDERGDAKYQRESVGWGSAGRRVHAVCWHGFRDYFRAVFAKCPEAQFRTAFDTWRGADDFEARYRDSGRRNIGPHIAPVYAAEACRCPEAGML